MITTENVALFALVLMRMSGCVFLNPIIGRRNFPAMFKTGMTLVLTILVVTYSPARIPEITTTIEYFVLLAGEFAVGYIIGFVISLVSYVISFGGEIIDMQMGLSMSKVFDPQSNVSMTLSATYLNILYIFLFLAAGGHITMIRLFALSGEIIPYGAIAINSGLSVAILDVFKQCTVLAVKLALPIIFVELVVEVGMGLVMKAIPQINVFVINIQAKVLIGILILVALFVPFAEFLERLVTILFETLEQVLVLMR